MASMAPPAESADGLARSRSNTASSNGSIGSNGGGPPPANAPSPMAPRPGQRPRMNLLPRTAPTANKGQIPLVCHGHTRPVVDVHYSAQLSHAFAARYASETATTLPPYLLFSSSKDGTAVIRDGATGDWMATLKGHKGCIWSCRLSRDGSLGVTGSADFTAKLWDIQTRQELLTFPHPHIVRAVDISADSRYVATAGHDKLVRVYDLNGPIDPATGAMEPIRKLEGSTSVIKSMLFDSDRGLIFTGDDRDMRVWDLRVAAQVNTRSFDAPLGCLRYSPSQKYVMTAAGSQISFWDADTAALHRTLDVQHAVSSVDLHPTEDKLVFGTALDCEVRVARFTTGEILETYKGHHGPIHIVQYSPDGDRYASGSEDGTVRIWRTDAAAAAAEAAAGSRGPASTSGVMKVAPDADHAKSPPFHLSPAAAAPPYMGKGRGAMHGMGPVGPPPVSGPGRHSRPPVHPPPLQFGSPYGYPAPPGGFMYGNGGPPPMGFQPQPMLAGYSNSPIASPYHQYFPNTPFGNGGGSAVSTPLGYMDPNAAAFFAGAGRGMSPMAPGPPSPMDQRGFAPFAGQGGGNRRSTRPSVSASTAAAVAAAAIAAGASGRSSAKVTPSAESAAPPLSISVDALAPHLIAGASYYNVPSPATAGAAGGLVARALPPHLGAPDLVPHANSALLSPFPETGSISRAPEDSAAAEAPAGQ